MSDPPIRFPDGFRLLVCGGRDYADRSHVWATLDRVHRKRPLGLVIHGDAGKEDEEGNVLCGADKLGAAWGIERGIEVWKFKAKWIVNGSLDRGAGHKRNQEMLNVGRPMGVVAFPGGPGTADMIRRAEAAGVPVMRA